MQRMGSLAANQLVTTPAWGLADHQSEPHCDKISLSRTFCTAVARILHGSITETQLVRRERIVHSQNKTSASCKHSTRGTGVPVCPPNLTGMMCLKQQAPQGSFLGAVVRQSEGGLGCPRERQPGTRPAPQTGTVGNEEDGKEHAKKAHEKGGRALSNSTLGVVATGPERLLVCGEVAGQPTGHKRQSREPAECTVGAKRSNAAPCVGQSGICQFVKARPEHHRGTGQGAQSKSCNSIGDCLHPGAVLDSNANCRDAIHSTE